MSLSSFNNKYCKNQKPRLTIKELPKIKMLKEPMSPPWMQQKQFKLSQSNKSKIIYFDLMSIHQKRLSSSLVKPTKVKSKISNIFRKAEMEERYLNLVGKW